jgi:hypothetical protein
LQGSLQPALLETVGRLDIAELDAQAAAFVPKDGLRLLASAGMRSEMVFALPMVLEARPTLLTYYRALLGYSQKEFFGSSTGLGKFKKAEEGVDFSTNARLLLPQLCECVNAQAAQLLAGLSGLPLSGALIRDLSLLTIGPQFRGGSNNARGALGIDTVFNAIRAAVDHADITHASQGRLVFTNAARRTIVVAVAADPDVTVVELDGSQRSRPLLAIEVKTGTDGSNIHNRIGEAEKSHLKARAKGFNECWTIINAKVSAADAVRQSPSTSRFFALSDVVVPGQSLGTEFARSILALTGVAAPNAPRRRQR